MPGLVIQPQPSPMPAGQRMAQVPQAVIQRSTFNRDHTLKTTIDADWLVPVLIDEMLPGDTFHCNMTAFARLATPYRPVMDNMFLDSFFFFVPNRLVWDNWKRMNGEQDDPSSSVAYTMPKMTGGGGYANPCGSLYDYAGLPLATYTGLTQITSLPFRCYVEIWNTWFRDQNLQNHVDVPKNNGPDDFTIYSLLRRGKRKDYFTGCLPWPQKGNAVTLPLGTSAPVTWASPTQYMNEISKTVGGASRGTLYEDNAGTLSATVSGDGGWDVRMEGPKPLDGIADLSTATAATINSIRLAFQMQVMLERDARGGTRYTEIIRSHFGVVSPDARLQRPELLGTGETPVHIDPVANTAAESGGYNLGALAGYGYASCSGGHGFTYSATEHGYVIGLVSVRADLTYQYGIERMWLRDTRYDFYWPALAHLGEQIVENQEIFFSNNPTTDNDEFGYQERYAEYRYKPSKLTGLMRSNASVGGGTSVDIWHLAEDNKVAGTPTLPVLSDAWIQSQTPLDRVVKTPSEPHFYLDCYFHYRCARPMPVYSVPGLTDHF